MKIELWYDYIYVNTQVRMNDSWQEGRDIYAFLYPVRNYPLQTWLYPAGSWSGIARQLRDIARGEVIELTFCGRAEDAQDLAAAVEGMEHLALDVQEWDVRAFYQQNLQQLKERLGELKQRFPMGAALTKKITGWRFRKPREEDWLIPIASGEALQAAEKDPRPCCMVDGALLGSLEDLHQLERLTRSLQRPMDAVCCCFARQQAREAFAAYASQFPRLQFRFAGPDEGAWKQVLWNRYGEASWSVGRLQEGAGLCLEVQQFLEEQKAASDKTRMRLIHKKSSQGLDAGEEEQLRHCQELAAYLLDAGNTWQQQKDHIEMRAAASIVCQSAEENTKRGESNE